ncbi:hypothetical protein ZTR_05949 [Talaromyces verruculosus]|nr:hypothetical protein ZTR_05949 [Talaromyces verruculosus]
MSTLVKFEPVVDKVIQKLLERLKHDFVVESGPPRRCDIADWLQFCSKSKDAFDVITELTFSQPLGFLDNGKDMGDYMRKLDDAIDADAPISQLPWLGYLKKKNPLTGLFAQDSSFVVSFVAERIRSRLGDRDKDEIISSDMLGLILETRKPHLDVVTDTMAWSYCMTNIASGSDSVSVPLRSIIYFVLRDDAIYRKLTREICDANLRSPVSWKDSRQLPYLDAVIKEALRLHPPVGLGLERVVPEGGLRLETLCD